MYPKPTKRRILSGICAVEHFRCFSGSKFLKMVHFIFSASISIFEQVIVFAEDYRLSDVSSLCNHYVAVTRAKSKLIIVKQNSYNANCFQVNLEKLFAKSGVKINDVLVQI